MSADAIPSLVAVLVRSIHAGVIAVGDDGDNILGAGSGKVRPRGCELVWSCVTAEPVVPELGSSGGNAQKGGKRQQL